MQCAWFGTGLLGKPMAEQLLKTGHDVAVWNRTADKAASLREDGARLAQHPAQALESSEYVFLMLADAQAIEEVLFQQALSSGNEEAGGTHALQNKVVIQMGTIASQESIEFDRRVRHAGGVYIEAPVLGSIPQARDRELIVIIGARRSDYEKHQSVLAAFGSERIHVGEVGQAAVMKLALNHLIASLTTSFSISLGLIRRGQVDVDAFMSILRDSALYAPTFDKKLQKMLDRDFSNPNFPAKHMLKDVLLVSQEAGRLGLAGELLDALEATLRHTLAAGHADSDYSALYEAVDPPA